MTWDQGVTKCTQVHQLARMVVINSQEKQDFVISQMVTKKLWLGCRDWEGTGNWTCLDHDGGGDLTLGHIKYDNGDSSSGYWSKL